MQCSKCESPAVTLIRYSGQHLCDGHFRDFVELWAKGEYHPLPLSRQAVDAAADTTMKLTPP